MRSRKSTLRLMAEDGPMPMAAAIAEQYSSEFQDARVMRPAMARRLTDRSSGRAAGGSSATAIASSGGPPLNFSR